MTPYAEVIGDPIEHSLSPRLQRYFLDRMGLAGEYRALRVTEGELGDYFEARQRDEHWRGCNITMPHKLAALAYAPHRTDPSFPVEPISLAVRKPDGGLEGHPLDAMALVQSLLGSSLRFAGQSGPAIVIGAGGAAQAAMWALAHFGCSPIWIVNRSLAKAQAAAAVRTRIGVQVLERGAAIPPANILINATPLGMAGHGEVDIDLDALPDDAIVYDMIYAPLETGLLRRARARGLITFDGLDMLIPQVAVSCTLLFGWDRKSFAKEIPREMWADARAAVLT